AVSERICFAAERPNRLYALRGRGEGYGWKNKLDGDGPRHNRLARPVQRDDQGRVPRHNQPRNPLARSRNARGIIEAKLGRYEGAPRARGRVVRLNVRTFEGWKVGGRLAVCAGRILRDATLKGCVGCQRAEGDHVKKQQFSQRFYQKYGCGHSRPRYKLA